MAKGEQRKMMSDRQHAEVQRQKHMKELAEKTGRIPSWWGLRPGEHPRMPLKPPGQR
jgi:hypothetical protein